MNRVRAAGSRARAAGSRARAALALLLLAGRAAAAQEGPPPPGPVTPVAFPEVHERALANGAQLLVVENREQPVVTVSLRIRSGRAFDPPAKAGVAEFTAALLNKGTAARDAATIAETMDFIGASLGAEVTQDWTDVTVTTLTEFLDTALVVLADIVQNPTFPENELETERARALTALRVELSQPAAVAERRFLEAVYGEHPYGRRPTPETVQAITRDDLVRFHATHYRAGNALFVVAGDVHPDDVARRLDAHFRGWARGTPPALRPPAPPQRTAREIRLYHKPGAVQAVVRAGHLAPPATHRDWIALDVALQVLGGGSTGWLFDVLREQKGYTYGAYAGAGKAVGPGYVQAVAEVRNEVADSALAALLALLDSVRTAVPARDLGLAQSYITGSFPREIETPQQVAGQIATARLRGLPRDYVPRYRERVARLTAERVRDAARTHLHPDRAVVVVVGDATRVLEKLEPFGIVRLFDVEGRPLAREDLEVRAAEAALDASGVRPMTLVSTLAAEGNPVGEFTATVTREERDGRAVVREVTRGGGMGFTIEEDIVFATDFTPISTRFVQQVGPARLVVELAYADGRVTGHVVRPEGDTARVDIAVARGTLLPGMETWAVLLAELAPGAEIRWPAFNAQSRAPYTLSVRVTGDTTVTVPAGTFEAYAVELATAQGTTRVWVRKEWPHLVLRQEFPGAPLALELKEIR